MNTVRQVIVSDSLPRADRSASTAKGDGSTPQEAQDSVSLESTILSMPAKAAGKVVGIASGTVEALLNVLPGIAGGLVESVDEGSGYGPLVAATILETTAAGAAAGSVFFGAPGAIGGGIGGVFYGLVNFGINQESGASPGMANRLSRAVKDGLSDNVPTGKKSRDVAKNLSEGAVLGTIVETKLGWSAGYEKGRGLVSGISEGAKGIGGIISGSIGPKPEEEKPAAEGVDKQGAFRKAFTALLKVPLKAAEISTGLVSGTVGAVVTIPTALIQGIGEGATRQFDGDSNSAYLFHRGMTFTGIVAATAAAGFMMAGPPGLLIGLGAGAAGGAVVARIQRKSGADKELAGNISQTLEAAASDNIETGSPVHDVTRNAVEGAMVGTAAGIKEGFRSGYQGGVGVVEGIAEGIGGVMCAIGDIAGKK